MNRTLQSQITSIINGVDDMTIATVRDDGYPQATTVSYVNDEQTIYFLTSKRAQKVRNIEHDKRVSVTINCPYEDWNDIEGLSMAASAQLVSEPEELARVGELLLEKYPQIAELESDDPEEFVIVRVEPKWISVLDYSKGFGHTELVQVHAQRCDVDASIQARYPEG